jgi:hypothetical protein
LAACDAGEVQNRGRLVWLIYTVIWVGVVVILLLGGVLTARMEGGPVDWAVVVPLAVLIPAGSIAVTIYGNHRSDRG